MYPSSLPQRGSLIAILFPAFAIVLSIFAGYASGQVINPGGRNNPYSPSPGSKTLAVSTVPIIPTNESNQQIAMVQRSNDPGRGTEASSPRPTEIYQVGVGDVLLIDLKNSDEGSGYFTVKGDGTIDYPLAGDNVIAADMSVDAIQKLLESGIKLFQEPSVTVTVREYGSHKISVTGMVASGGERSLQREAMPLYAIRAQAVVDRKATRVTITHGPLPTNESFELADAETDNVLIYPGDKVEFTGENGSSNSTGEYYFIGGDVISSGQKQLSTGLTLYQAVVASGSPKGNPKKATIRRKNTKGLFDVLEHSLKAIRDGKAADPALAPGDIVEIRN
jgi:protein involved in polysaccharide export with SLBB domain